MSQSLFELAKSCGFTEAAPLDVATLQVEPEVRAMCAENKCHAYGKNWTCPPVCGTLEECAAQMQRYAHGILLQTHGELEDEFDIEGMMELEKRHMTALHAFAKQLRQQHPEALCLGAGGCRVCKSCNYPEPCRFPEQACSSMEGYGLLVSAVCKANNLAYYYGPSTLCYTACCLY